MTALIAALGWLSFAWLAGVALFVSGDLYRCCPGLVVGVLARPALAVANTVVLGWLHFVRRSPGRAARGATLALATITILLLGAGLAEGAGPIGGASPLRSLRLPLLLPIALTAALYGLARLVLPPHRLLPPTLGLAPPADGRAARRGALVAFSGAAVALVATLAALPAAGPSVNRFGLVCFPPRTTAVEDYTGNPRVDDYPKVTNQYNSLGYRDEEPPAPARQRVLVVGDSCVWGHGIATNEETLPAQLRRTLEGARPGRFDVVAAAFPGNGVYGYSRAVRALADPLGVKVAVIGYLGDNDHDPLDAQAIMDRTPSRGPLRRLVTGLSIRQYVHACARRGLGRPGPALARRLRDQARREVDELARFAAARGIRLVVVHYFSPGEPSRIDPWPPGVVEIHLPDELRYPGRRNDYWYAKDVHPRPALNRRIAELIAARLAEPASRPAATAR